jgi:1-deoxyxylulose-5-phosphate synthase
VFGSYYDTPIEETMEALHDVVKMGKARYIGASSMWAWQFAKMQRAAEQNGWTKFVSMQNHYNLVYREEEREMIPMCIDMGVGIIPWSPLARGFLAGNRSREKIAEDQTTRAKTDGMAHDMYYTDADFEIVEHLKALAAEHGLKPAQLALAWMLNKPGISSPIIGASKPYQLEEAVAVADLKLDSAVIERLEAPYQPKQIFGHS